MLLGMTLAPLGRFCERFWAELCPKGVPESLLTRVLSYRMLSLVGMKRERLF